MNKIKIKFILLMIAILFGIFIFGYYLDKLKNFDVDESNSGLNTISITNFYSKKKINTIVQNQSSNLFGEILNTIKESDSKYKCLWFGASQLHAINNYKKGEKLAFCVANSINTNDKISHFQFSSGNANFHDVLSMFMACLKEGIKPNLLIIPLVYDDLREYPIQDRLLIGLNKNDISKYCEYSRGHFEKQMNLVKIQNRNITIQKNVIENTPQVKLEENIVEAIGNVFPDFQKRSNLYNYYHSMLYTNSVKFFGSIYGVITQPSKDAIRYPIVEDTIKSWNLLALNDIIRLAKNNNVKVLFYRQPIRPTKGVFYHELKGYNNFYLDLVNNFKRDQNNIFFVDLQKIVPQKHWGKTNLNQPDVFHFTAFGHKILGDTIAELAKKIFLKK